MMQLRHFFSHKTFIFFTSPLVLPPPNAHGTPSTLPNEVSADGNRERGHTLPRESGCVLPEDRDESPRVTGTSHRG